MIKLVTFQKRAPGMSRPEFEDRWLTIHGPIAAKFPGLRGYMLGFSIEEGEPPADGVAQLWFDSRIACQSSYASDIGRKGSADAIAYLGRRQHLLLSERWLRRASSLAATPYKLVISAKRRAGQARAEFVAWWPEAFPAIAADLGASQSRVSIDETGQLLNSATSGPLDLVTTEGIYDGMLELWFPDEARLRTALADFRVKHAALVATEVGVSEISALVEHVVVMPPAPVYGLTES